MAQHGGESLHVHTVLQCQRRKGVPQVMEPYVPALRVLQDEPQSATYYTGGEGRFSFTGDGNIHRKSTVFLYSCSTSTTAGGTEFSRKIRPRR